MEPRKLILKCGLSPGDIVMLTAAVRDLHRAAPGKFLTDVRTPCPALWEHNPHLTRIEDGDPGAETIECHYPLIHRSNESPYHFIHGFLPQFLSERLGLPIAPTEFKGDLHLSDREKGWFSQVREIVGRTSPTGSSRPGGRWTSPSSGGKPAATRRSSTTFAGWSSSSRVGADEHHHPTLDGVIDLRGKTDLRQLVRLVYHAAGALCPVTLLMHLAAAVPTKDGSFRPGVVVAGGREPPQWEAYPRPPVPPHRGRPALLREGRLLEEPDGPAWRRG